MAAINLSEMKNDNAKALSGISSHLDYRRCLTFLQYNRSPRAM